MIKNYDIIHFEALGEEARHLVDETKAAQECGLIPTDLRYLVTPQNLQEFFKAESTGGTARYHQY